MKRILVVGLLLIAGKCLEAQAVPELKLSPKKGEKQLVFPKNPLYTIQNFSGRTMHADTAQLSNATAAGRIYLLPQDKMPCLQPDSSIVYNMPVKAIQLNTTGKIPNAFQSKPLVW
jgi:hypothetical protein